MNLLFLGDPHCQISNLEESERLLEFFHNRILELKPDKAIILGDIFHSMALVRAEVLDFWNRWLAKLSSSGTRVIVLVGNHDLVSRAHESIHSLSSLKRIEESPYSDLKIVDIPYAEDNFVFMPYTHDKETFIELANQGRGKVLICHQTFDGSTFENGFYAPDGIDANKLKFDTIVSGHIHARQRFGKVIYPGTARWLTVSDANQPKGLWLTNFDDSTGKILNEEFIDTSHVCTPIVSFTWSEGQEMPKIPGNAKVGLELIGSSDWVIKHKKLLKGQFSLKIKITDKVNKEHRKTGTNFQDFLQNLYVTNTDKNKLLEMAKGFDIV